MKKKKSSVKIIAILGGLAVATILVGGTLWTGRTASRDTQKAVQNVSLLFMNEQASLCELDIVSILTNYIDDIDIALGLMEDDDLSSVAKLQVYQAKVRQLYSLEKFAFVDTNGLIYTSRGTRNDINLYGFDYKSISHPEISIKKQNGPNKKVVIAVPVDSLPFNGQTLVTCFMEIDMKRMLERISLQTGNNRDTTFSIYTKDGILLSDMILGGLPSEENILSALEDASFDKGYSVEKMREDFHNREEGFSSFTYNGTSETLYYVPIHNTDWVLAYFISKGVISNQIRSISERIILRSLCFSIVVALVLMGLFALIMLQANKTAKLTLEKEVTDAENRIKQEELEEQLALQQQIARHKRKRDEQDNMITALASDYRSVYYVDLESDSCICYRQDSGQENPFFKEGEHFTFSQAFADYANEFVAKDHRERFLAFIDANAIRQKLLKAPLISTRYLTIRNGKETYEMLRIARVQSEEEMTDGTIRIVGMGFTDVDEETRDTIEKSKALSDALQAAEEANKAKTIFLSNMSHEIRTPMNAILGLDSLALHEEGISEKTRGYLKKIGSSAEHLLSLINDILDMSRIESGRMVLRNEEFEFEKLLEQVNTLISSQCNEKKLSYTCNIKGHLDNYYTGDAMKIRQVLINILSNAVKFTPEGGSIDLTIEKTAGFDKKSTLRFTISDTGIGMSAEYLPKIFDAFTQENSGTANKYGSSGLGMAITKSIVEMMNGNISVESEKGKGTTFTVTITLNDSERTAGNSGQEIKIDPKNLNVLVIDDDRVALDHAKLVLEGAGIIAETALSGQEGLEMVKLRHARREPYNLIIVDWKMPGMDGVETTRQIRAATQDESTIIILTSYNWDDILDEALKAGVDSFIAKPIFSNTLLEEFKRTLEKKNGTAPVKTEKANLNGKRILLAEDMEINAQIMIEILAMRGMTTEHAENGKIAVDMFASHPQGYYDAILMDMRMPEMDGLEATEAIRRMQRDDSRTIPIIALTANAFDEDVKRSLQAGLNAHLSKPVQPDVLFETLEGIL